MLRWVHVGVGGTDDDLNLRVKLAYLLCGPDAIRARWHAHVEKRNGEWALRGAGFPNGGNGRFSATAEDGLEGLLRRRHAPHQCGIGADHEQAGPQLVERSPIAGGCRGVQHLSISVEHRLLVVNDQHANLCP